MNTILFSFFCSWFFDWSLGDFFDYFRFCNWFSSFFSCWLFGNNFFDGCFFADTLGLPDIYKGSFDTYLHYGGQLSYLDPVTVLPHINAGRLNALAVTSPQRSPVAPQIPTMAESGYPDIEAVAWHGILAPARTPPDIIKKLNAEFVKALQDPSVKSLLDNQAMQVVGDTPEQFAAFLRKDLATWKDVAAMANVSVE